LHKSQYKQWLGVFQKIVLVNINNVWTSFVRLEMVNIMRDYALAVFAIVAAAQATMIRFGESIFV
jgi:hypothetical protein